MFMGGAMKKSSPECALNQCEMIYKTQFYPLGIICVPLKELFNIQSMPNQQSLQSIGWGLCLSTLQVDLKYL